MQSDKDYKCIQMHFRFDRHHANGLITAFGEKITHTPYTVCVCVQYTYVYLFHSNIKWPTALLNANNILSLLIGFILVHTMPTHKLRLRLRLSMAWQWKVDAYGKSENKSKKREKITKAKHHLLICNWIFNIEYAFTYYHGLVSLSIQLVEWIGRTQTHTHSQYQWLK